MQFLAGFPGVRIAQIVGIGASGYLSGFISAASILGVPPLLLAAPDVATKQWAKLYHTGAAIAPTTAGVAFLAYLYLGYHSGHYVSPSEGYAYLAAGTLTLAIAPYTLLTMMSTNNELKALAEGKEEKVVEEARVKALLQKWWSLNLVRALGPATGFVLGLFALGGYFA
ncbi:uncharacterized protein C8Q71DRAFT_743817 [Rhodofomes roseus]|uniref:DUF1772-domain-containing protein n=1 Tax=Rhodofomes roseus TaxID=34475 RepID=A0ABQ8KNG9_9APHY|nr:uncharacterized protein C8Q71DRAFT_743817 [Rhodofomes roseus]KAH9839698.1 hypothetical protein C8Q71DRAFT_743817 [Rhodofomes roseus]